MIDFTDLVDLASERLGGAVLWATDEFFAPKESLLKASAPVFLADKYTEYGKWMDGWETRRHRAPDHDWCLIRLGVPGIIRGVIVDTAHFTGNFPEQCSVEGSADQEVWTELLPASPLRGGSQNSFPIADPYRYTHLRLHIYPDGGVARLRVHGEAVPDQLEGCLDLAAARNGGRVVEASDMYFGSRHNLIFPGRSAGMHDGWETRRRRGPGHDWCVIELATHGEIHRVEVDTSHFKGNFPESCSLETEEGQVVLPRVKLGAHKRHVFEKELKPVSASRVRFCIYPDGGVSRLRIFGPPTEEGRAVHRLRLLNTVTPPEAQKRFLACCGSQRWANVMKDARPFLSPQAIVDTAVQIWRGLEPTDWLEAFAAHPRIGERTADRHAAAEQSGTHSASETTLDELRRLNEEYAAKFGYIFIVFASGKSAEQMPQLLRARLSNDPEMETGIAAEEQLAITKARIQKIGFS
jgi:allantoicase